MKYCYQCGRVTVGEPLYCNSCGRSYNVKLCPRHHANPRSAEVCAQCGSRDLSTPQPRVPISIRVLAFLLSLGPGLLLVLVSVLAYAGLRPGEALALRWRHIGQRTITVEQAVSFGEMKNTKTNSSRTVRLLDGRVLVDAHAEHLS